MYCVNFMEIMFCTEEGHTEFLYHIDILVGHVNMLQPFSGIDAVTLMETEAVSRQAPMQHPDGD